MALDHVGNTAETLRKRWISRRGGMGAEKNTVSNEEYVQFTIKSRVLTGQMRVLMCRRLQCNLTGIKTGTDVEPNLNIPQA